MNDAIAATLMTMGRSARAASRHLAQASPAQKNVALQFSARAVRAAAAEILAANREDFSSAAAAGATGAMLDRLQLNPERIELIAESLEAIAGLVDPIGTILSDWTRPNGIRIQRVRVPLGVIGIIYESRPNVTADAGAICLKSGNAVILRGGSESSMSSAAIHRCLVSGLRAADLPESCIQLVPTSDRAAVGIMLAEMADFIDVIVPRGGKKLIERVQNEARVPVIGHLEGNCHVFVERHADPEMAKRIVLNAKLRRTGVCGAAETLLVDTGAAVPLLAPLVVALLDAGCEVRGCVETLKIDTRVKAATDQDWSAEYLDAIIAVRLVDGTAAAVEHINRFGSQHTEAIVTNDPSAARLFLQQVDSAIVLHNASTQFADGGEFGMGAEIGISTDKFHARGPVGVEELTSYKYWVFGSGQIR